MKNEKTKRIDDETNGFLGRLVAEKKKCVTALCLIVLMVFMWVRVIGNKKLQSAEAAPVSRETAKDASDSAPKISFTDLPSAKGRNDTLTRDFFTVDNWPNFISAKGAGRGKTNIFSKNGDEEVIGQIAEKMKLEVIEMNKNPKAFINGRLLSTGDKFFVEYGDGNCECKVAEIEQNAVTVKCGDSEIRLKLMQEVGSAY